MLSIFYPGLEIKLKHTWPCSKFAYAYKKKACIVSPKWSFYRYHLNYKYDFTCLSISDGKIIWVLMALSPFKTFETFTGNSLLVKKYNDENFCKVF